MKTKSLTTLFILVFTFGYLSAQQKFSLSGFVRDAETGEELIGVTVYISELSSGVVTNVYGFYSITLPAGSHEVRYSYIGYQSQSFLIDLNTDLTKDVELSIASETMSEVVIMGKAQNANVTNLEMSTERIDIAQLKKMPSLFGEPDLIKAIQMMPGVITAGEGTSSYFVRGGSADQNLILIDEAPIYDPSHLFGYISVFNADVVKDSKLYKGGIPAAYGGRLSSILDVRTIDGNKKKFGVKAGIGTLASKIMIEGPIKKDVGSYLLSARRSYADLFLKIAGNDNSVYFYDVNAKVNWNLGPKDKLYVAGYFGRDAFSLGGAFTFDWGNTTGTLRWNHLFNSKLFSNTTFIASKFDYGLALEDESLGFKWTSIINEYSFKQHFTWFATPKVELDFGYDGTFRLFRPGKITSNAEASIFTDVELQRLQALDHALFINNKHTISDRFSMDYGLRLSIFQQVGPGDVYTYSDPKDNVNIEVLSTQTFEKWQNIKTYVNWEPRLSGRVILNDLSSLKFSYNRMVQNVHLISSGTVPLPFNTWYPSSTYLNPQIADQVAIGYFRNMNNNMFEGSVEAFYKWLDNVTDFADNADIFFNEFLDTEFRQGESTAYGFETQIKKVKGDLTGFINYTWSRVERIIPEVNQGKVFFANYDRRNSLNMLLAYELNDKWSFSTTFTYSTGRPITLPTGQYEVQQFTPSLVTERNGYKMPDFHRADVSAVLVPRKNANRRMQTKWVFSIYNVYNRKNAFTIYSQDQEDANGDPTGNKEFIMVYLFPIVPSVTFNLSF